MKFIIHNYRRPSIRGNGSIELALMDNSVRSYKRPSNLKNHTSLNKEVKDDGSSLSELSSDNLWNEIHKYGGTLIDFKSNYDYLSKSKSKANRTARDITLEQIGILDNRVIFAIYNI